MADQVLVQVTVIAEGVTNEGVSLNIGERTEIPEDLVANWVNSGIARLGWDEAWISKAGTLTRVSSQWR